MKNSIIGLIVLVSGIVQAANETCVYPATEYYGNKMAEFANQYGWQADCNARFIGKDFSLNGVNQTALNILAQKTNSVLREGQKPRTPEQLAQGLIFLYEFFEGQGVEQAVQAMTMQMINNYFGSTNQYASLGVNSYPEWYTDSNCYEKAGSMAYFMRNDTIAGLGLGIQTFVWQLIKNFQSPCDAFNPNFDAAFEELNNFSDRMYVYCQTLVSR